MQVRDLIYLLQTKAKPEDEIIFEFYVDKKNSMYELTEESHMCNFETIRTVTDEFYGDVCILNIPAEIIKAIAEALAKPDEPDEPIEPFPVAKKKKKKA